MIILKKKEEKKEICCSSSEQTPCGFRMKSADVPVWLSLHRRGEKLFVICLMGRVGYARGSGKWATCILTDGPKCFSRSARSGEARLLVPCRSARNPGQMKSTQPFLRAKRNTLIWWRKERKKNNSKCFLFPANDLNKHQVQMCDHLVRLQYHRI